MDLICIIPIWDVYNHYFKNRLLRTRLELCWFQVPNHKTLKPGMMPTGLKQKLLFLVYNM
jgi:hypothetical protein